MKILVIGQSVIDYITDGNKLQVKPGGIFYTCLGLSEIADSEDEIVLLSLIDSENYSYFTQVYNKLNVNYATKVDSISKAHLTIWNNKERTEECYVNKEKIHLLEGHDYDTFNGILINMISGYDIYLEDLKLIRKKFNGTIYLDIHCLSRELNQNNIREFRRIQNSEDWLYNVDIIQTNELESKTLCGFKEEFDIAKCVLETGVKIFLITKSELGTVLYTYEGDRPIKIEAPPINVEVKNKVGCGDIFGSVFFYSYIKNNNYVNSLNLANKAGALAASYGKIKDFKRFKYDLFGADD